MSDLWNHRYRTEGEIWGREPSPTLALLRPRLSPKSRVLEIGFGYGRDLAWLLQDGHRVVGFETAAESFNLHDSPIDMTSAADRVHLCFGDVTTCPLQPGSFDAIFSHRTLHLIPPGEIDALAAKIEQLLRPGGIACLSARDPRDFDERQMRWIEPGLAEYITSGRAGHRIHFWDETRFSATFASQLSRLTFHEETEPEAKSNEGADAHFTIMLATKPG